MHIYLYIYYDKMKWLLFKAYLIGNRFYQLTFYDKLLFIEFQLNTYKNKIRSNDKQAENYANTTLKLAFTYIHTCIYIYISLNSS